MSRHAFIPASVAMLLALAACSNDGKVAGGTEAESTIALQVQLADGTPAANARVRVLPGDYLSDGVNDAEWTASDRNGFVEMTAEPGDYAVEVRNVAGTVPPAVGADRGERLVRADADVAQLPHGLERLVGDGRGQLLLELRVADRGRERDWLRNNSRHSHE